ncbi:MAG: hypothetical protein M1313_08120 [Nitrospirae bacterium]|jgi:hypothetical protein|nr:hypothetical protein [Nitrospirota bacterium]
MVDKQYVLTPDKKGALTSGLFHGSALVLSGILSFGYIVHHQTSSLWFYLFFGAFWLVLFSGFTSIVNQCLLLTPRSLKSIRTTGSSIILEWKNGDADELVRKIQCHGSRTILGIWGQTVDKRRVQTTLRRNSLPPEKVQELLSDIDRIQALEKRTA